MRLFLVRHGETEHNRQNLALGRADVPLNETGLQQAAALGRALATEKLAAVYSSPLIRTRRTAEAIAAPHHLDVVIDDGLIEMEVGEMDGMTFPDVREKYPGYIERWLGPDGPEQAMPGGERLVDVRDRAWAAVQVLVAKHQDESICAVTHNFAILSLLTQVAGVELANFRKFRHAVAAITRVEWRQGRPRILSMNDTCHLEG
ncbi:MAG: histidine phosphatase family protein [Dehalococcoidia bacterium]